ncbi:MAG: hypothetical protein NC328_07185 [Muribaculum sp.]|nr:hypothetical protein [Muribaculum sp.]
MTIENIPLPASKFSTGAVSKEMEIKVPSEVNFNRIARKTDQELNKNEIWDKLRPYISLVEKGVTINWTEEEDLKTQPSKLKEAPKYLNAVLQKKSGSLKRQLTQLYAVIYWNPENVQNVAYKLFKKKTMELAREIVETGAMDIEKICERMQWPAPGRRYSWYSVDPDFVKRWNSSSTTLPLSMLCKFCNGRKEKKDGGRYYDTIYYVVPSAALIDFVLKNSDLDVKAIGEEDLPKEDVVFQGGDFMRSAVTLEQLINSETIKTGITKLPIAAVKKMQKYLPIKEFPYTEDGAMTRSEYLLSLAFLCFGGLTQRSAKIPQPPKDNETFLKQMYEGLNLQDRSFVENLITPYVRGLNNEFFYYKAHIMRYFSFGITFSMTGSCMNQGKWMPYETLYWKVEKSMSGIGVPYIYPDGYYEDTINVYIPPAEYLPMSKFKAAINDVLLYEVVLGHAALGALDIALNKQGGITYVRLTEIGKWLYGFRKDFPMENESSVKPTDILEIDDTTLNILVKDTSSYVIPMLPDYAEKVRDNRYVLSTEVFCKGVTDKETLREKIDRFHMFVCPNPGPGVKAFLDRLLSRCDAVKKTPGGSGYTLVSVDPSNREAQEVIANNREIRKNVLMVEGCRLLVKNKFISQFEELLRVYGFIVKI